jgi:flagellar biosynthesis anti-sigma factor FlgM
MKIDETNPRPLGPVAAGYGPTPSTTRAGDGSRATPAAAGPAVRVELSARSRELAAVLAAAAAAPDVRAERLEALRRELTAGTYRVDPVVVARAMLEGTR